ncbi:MAG: N-acetylmuramoyl-L-alanine amidase [Anaerolineales bacterium]|nr:N-acetylmuramoyl-L-alanine amidase [Anaerolineales bacterium]
MRAAYEDEQPDRPVMRFIRRNLSLLAFLALAGAAMMGAYVYFSPASGVAEVVAAGSSAGALSAPFVKPVPARPVLQRLIQSPGPIRVGVISGHKGNDSGAVCADGLTEAEVNENIAVRVVSALQARGIAADLLTEFDPRLDGYVATALVSIHADSCDYINDVATGFKIAGSGYTDSSSLSICVEDAYRRATEMSYHANTITPDMADYQAFRRISSGVPAIIIEVGFMNLDRPMLTQQPDRVAGGITDGIWCFLDQIRSGVSYAPQFAIPPDGG